MSKSSRLRRGRPETDAAERLRVAVWYQALRARGWSDYRLDLTFGDKDASVRSRGMDRKRVFETIRKERTAPPQNLIARVDRHSEFRGTAQIFHSIFWKLAASRSLSLLEAHKLVNECFKQFRVRRLSTTSDRLYRWLVESYGCREYPTNLEVKSEHITSTNMEQLLARREVDLDLLALLGSLFREAYLAGALDVAIMYRNEYVRRLEEFCAQPWLGRVGNELLLLAEQRVLYWCVTEDNWKSLYEDWPQAVLDNCIVSEDDPGAQYILDHEDELMEQMHPRKPPEEK